MAQKIEVDLGDLCDLVYTWVRHVGIKRMPTKKEADEESFIRGAYVFEDKLRELIPKEGA